MTDSRRFPIRFTGVNKAMAVLGLRRTNSDVVVDTAEFHVRMGWAFRVTVPLASVHAVTDDHDRVLGWGVHGWRGVWLVNGSSSRIVRIDIDPAAQARMIGFPVRVTRLRVSVDDPSGLQAALRPHV